MTDTTNEQTLATEYSSSPECYMRINVSKTTKGYSHETTVSLRWENLTETTFSGPEYLVRTPSADDDDFTLKQPSRVLGELLRMADTAARDEITRRQQKDDGQA